MRVLVTGAKGQLGTAIRKVFATETVIAHDRDTFDITNRRDVQEMIQRERPDIIINCAAYNNVEKAGEEVALSFAVNAHGPFFLAEAAKAVNAILVHVSTDYVFDGEKGEYTEDDAPNPVNVYGISKLAGEMLVRAACEKMYLVRTSWLFGPSDASTRNFVTMMLQRANEGTVRVVSDQIGCPTYAPDLAKKIQELVTARAPFGVYHAANDGACSREEFAKEIFRIARISPAVTPISTAESGTVVRRPESSILRSNKIPPLRNWKEALGEYCDTISKS